MLSILRETQFKTMIALKECFSVFPGNIYQRLESEKAGVYIFLRKPLFYNLQNISNILDRASTHLGENQFANALCQSVKVDAAPTGLSLREISLHILLRGILTDGQGGWAALCVS